MITVSLKEYIAAKQVHTFLFENDIKLTMRDVKPTQYGEHRAKVEAWYGETCACSSAVTLWDSSSHGRFAFDASHRVQDVDWYDVLRIATATIEPRLSRRNDGVDMGVSWKSARDLMKKQFPKVQEIVPGILPVGATILASNPKLGKSRLMLDISIAVASGGTALGSIDVEQGDVLYLCLEDGEQLLQDRFADLLQGAEMPEGLDYADEWRRFDEGGLEDIERWLQSHPNAKLVVVDIFQRVKGGGRGHRNAYEVDYAAAAGVLDLAKRYLNVAIVIVHHTNKARDVQDPFDLVSGSRGLLGGVDGGMVMKAVPGRPGEATLEVSHRRLKVSPPKLALKTDPRTGGWSLLGEAKQVLLSEERQAILEMLAQSNAPVSYKLVASALGKPVDAVRMCMGRMARDGQIVPIGKGGYALLTPVHPVQRVHAVHPVQAVQSDNAQVRTEVNAPRCSPQRAHQQGIDGIFEQLNSLNSPSNNTALHASLNLDQDLAELFDAVDLTPIDDEPPADMLNVPRDRTAAISPAAHEADFSRRVQTIAERVRPTPSGSRSREEPPPLDEAYTEAMGEPVDGDRRLAATAKVSRTKAAGDSQHSWMFGHWAVKYSPPSGAQPLRDAACADADAMGKHKGHTHDYEEDTI